MLWDIEKFVAVKYLSVSNNAITYLILTNRYIAVFTYDGEIILVNKETWKIEAQMSSPYYSVN